MKLKFVFTTIGILSFHKDFLGNFVDGKSVQSEIETFKNCSQVNATYDCLLDEGRRRKGANNGNNIVIVEDGQGQGHIGGFGLGDYYTQESYGKKGRKKGKHKLKKHLKKMAPILMGLGGMKLVAYGLLMKKMALFSFLSFILSKVSFILASLVALKQFFQTPTHHRSADSTKLEVVHIPIRKHNKKQKEKDWIYDEESQFIPVTFPPDAFFDTTPYPPYYYNFPQNDIKPETVESDEENFDGNFDGKFNEKYSENDIYNEHFKEGGSSSYDRADGHTEKNYYKNHVHSPFV